MSVIGLKNNNKKYFLTETQDVSQVDSLNIIWSFLVVSPAEQKRDICTAFPAAAA